MERPAATTATRASSFLSLGKPGIVLGNALSLVGGYFLGARGTFLWTEFVGALAGLSLVVASAGAVNNVIDRDIDRLMDRTRGRPMARGELGVLEALAFALGLGATGFAILALSTNLAAVLAAACGFGVYVFAYSLWLKRRSVHGTAVGSVSGAMPPLVGYLAATGSFDLAALLLTLAFGFWQMPHSYAIGIFRGGDYRAAGIPLLPVRQGTRRAKVAMLVHVCAFAACVGAMAVLGPVGPLYAVLALPVALGWLGVVAVGPWIRDDVAWSRRVFLASLLVVTVLSLAQAVGGGPR